MLLGRFSGFAAGILAFSLLILGHAGPAFAEPTEVVALKGKNLILYKEATGGPAKRVSSSTAQPPLKIMGISKNGRYQVAIDGELWWIPKAQAVTDEIADAPPVNCQTLSTSYASSRGFGDCK